MSEEMKKQETMEDYMKEIDASFSDFRDDDMLIWDKLEQMKEDKTEFEVSVEGIVKGGAIAYVEGIRAFIPVSKLALNYVENPEDYLKKMCIRDRLLCLNILILQHSVFYTCIPHSRYRKSAA